MERIEIGTGRLAYRRAGTGTPLLLVSGLGGLASYWAPQIDAFAAAGYDVIAYDHRGVGESERSSPPYSVDAMADDAAKLLAALGIARAHVVGHSTGGAIAQTLAATQRDRLGAIVLAGSWTAADEWFRRLFALRRGLLMSEGAEAYVRASALFLYPPWFVANEAERVAAVERAMLASGVDRDIVAARIDAILAFDRRSDLPRLAIPTLVIGAEDDTITPGYFSHRLAAEIPDAELVMLARGGHVFTQTVPEAFNAPVLRFLQRHPL